ncbi:MAG: molybdopterin-binding/glycosyltransferase family 2 protein [Myxococcota bacterium]
MKFGPVPLARAHGAILAHSHRLSGAMLRKGTVLGDEELAALKAAGVASVEVARLEDGDLHEDAAADALSVAIVQPSIERGRAMTGRVNLFATEDGLLVVNADAIVAVNQVDEGITVATLPPWSVVRAGEMVGTDKIIPYAVPGALVTRAAARARAAGGLMGIAPLRARRVGLILSDVPGLPARLLERAETVQRERLAALHAALVRVDRVPHARPPIAQALTEQIEQGLDLVLFLGASAIIDRRDMLPAALESIGGVVEHLGLPMDPGNLLMLGRKKHTPVIGVPGCARSPKPSGFDTVLQRVLVGHPPTSSELAAMGVGGLLKDIPTRPHARQPAPPIQPQIGAVVLGAGRSTRMGEANKLLVEIGGQPLIRTAIQTLLNTAARPIIVVTGHQHDAVQAAVADLPVTFVHNPDFRAGMSTSLRAGVRALPDTVDGALIALGDMPFIQESDVQALIDAFAPQDGASICVPIHDKRQGHPVLWGRQHFAEMAALSGDVGARNILAANLDRRRLVAVGHAGVHIDVDTPEALDAVRARHADRSGMNAVICDPL